MLSYNIRVDRGPISFIGLYNDEELIRWWEVRENVLDNFLYNNVDSLLINPNSKKAENINYLIIREGWGLTEGWTWIPKLQKEAIGLKINPVPNKNTRIGDVFIIDGYYYKNQSVHYIYNGRYIIGEFAMLHHGEENFIDFPLNDNLYMTSNGHYKDGYPVGEWTRTLLDSDGDELTEIMDADFYKGNEVSLITDIINIIHNYKISWDYVNIIDDYKPKIINAQYLIENLVHY